MVLKITNLHILRYLPTCWLYLLECYTIDNQRCTHTASANNKSVSSESKYKSYCFSVAFIASSKYCLPPLYYVDLKTPKHKCVCMLAFSMFPPRKTYVSALRNVRFTDGKHTVLEWKT